MGSRSLVELLSANDGLGYLVLIALQFGSQPLLTRRCIEPGTPTTSLVIGQEVVKIVCCLSMLSFQGELVGLAASWTLRAFLLSSFPSLTYVCQNHLMQIAYQNIDGITFNLINQSKTLFAAVFVFLLTGRRQSRIQCVALVLVSACAVFVSISERSTPRADSAHTSWSLGVSSACGGAALSGLGAAVSEMILRVNKRNTFVFSLELSAIGVIMLGFSLVLDLTPDTAIFRSEGLFSRWGPWTLVPVLIQGIIGIVVGVVTKIAGSVRKGFAVVAGLVLTFVLQSLVQGDSILFTTYLSVPVVAVGTYLHAAYPPQVDTKMGADGDASSRLPKGKFA